MPAPAAHPSATRCLYAMPHRDHVHNPTAPSPSPQALNPPRSVHRAQTPPESCLNLFLLIRGSSARSCVSCCKDFPANFTFKSPSPQSPEAQCFLLLSASKWSGALVFYLFPKYVLCCGLLLLSLRDEKPNSEKGVHREHKRIWLSANTNATCCPDSTAGPSWAQTDLQGCSGRKPSRGCVL